MPTVNFVNEKKQIEVPAGANLRVEAMKAGIKLYGGLNGVGAGLNEVFNCHGLGHCGTCRVKIVKGIENASSMGAIEKFTFKYNPLGPALARLYAEATADPVLRSELEQLTAQRSALAALIGEPA